MSSFTRQQLEAWLRTIEVDGKVIDFGGSQKPLQGRVHLSESSEVDIFDLQNPHEKAVAPDFVGDINKRYEFLRALKQQYDYAFCLEVMEYVWNPNIAMKNIHRFLKKGGLLYMSTPFVYPVHNPYQQDYLRYTEHGIRKILWENQFEVLEYKHRTAGQTLEGFYHSEGMKPSREYKNHYSVGGLITAKKIK